MYNMKTKVFFQFEVITNVLNNYVYRYMVIKNV